MGIIRLILITAALIWLMMFYFGRDEGLPENRLGRAPTPAVLAEAPAPDAPPAAPKPAEAPEPVTPAPPSQPIATPETAPVEPAVNDPVAPEPVAEQKPQPVAEPEPAPEAVLYVTGRTVNVRAGPSTTFEAIASLTRGAAVVDLGDAGEGWHQILLDSGEIGYMSGDFLSPDPL